MDAVGERSLVLTRQPQVHPTFSKDHDHAPLQNRHRIRSLVGVEELPCKLDELIGSDAGLSNVQWRFIIFKEVRGHRMPFRTNLTSVHLLLQFLSSSAVSHGLRSAASILSMDRSSKIKPCWINLASFVSEIVDSLCPRPCRLNGLPTPGGQCDSDPKPD